MVNKNIEMYLLLVTALLLLYDLFFDITWLFTPHCYCVAHLVMIAIHTYVVMAVISLTFPSLSKLPCSLYIPGKQIHIPKTQSTGTLLHNVLHSQTMQNLDGIKVLVCSLLSFSYTIQSKAFSKHQPVKPFCFYSSPNMCWCNTPFPALLEGGLHNLFKESV